MELAEVVGQLAGLRRFPLRALGGEAPDEARVEGSGLVGDRVYDLYDEREGVLLHARSAPFLLRYKARYLDAMVRGTDLGPWIRVRKPDGVEVPLSDTEWVEEVSRRSGRALRLRPRPDAESDPAPLHVLSVPTLRFLEQQYGGPLEPTRLRFNVLLDLSGGPPLRGGPLDRPPALDRRRPGRDRAPERRVHRHEPRRRHAGARRRACSPRSPGAGRGRSASLPAR